ncbi:hypothetical protein [Chryseobacterium indicum]|uniref:hypothetical protein n=1 Tax=Chryseobacterium indicum TaxID=2766954 RepID=UPI001F3E5AA1|nr:hypothetical protein [Chryseobacterium sp. PS-8]
MLVGVAFIMSLMDFYPEITRIRGIAVEEAVFRIPALDYFVGLTAFDLGTTQTQRKFFPETFDFVFKNGCCFLFIETPASSAVKITHVAGNIEGPGSDDRLIVK